MDKNTRSGKIKEFEKGEINHGNIREFYFGTHISCIFFTLYLPKLFK